MARPEDPPPPDAARWKEINDALLAFDRDLHQWIDAGGEARARAFAPGRAWIAIVELLARDR